MGDDSRVAVSFEGVSFSYPGTGVGERAIEDVSLTVREGELLGIIGPNGGGKSTLLKLMLGLLRGNTGTILVDGASPAEARRRRAIGYVPQRSTASRAFPMDVRGGVLLAASAHISPFARVSAGIRESVDASLEFVGLEDLARAPIASLSGGQFQRFLIARALATEPKILALDEPTVGIDPAGRERFAELMTRMHREKGLTILIVSHDVRAVATGAAHCDRVACLSRTIHFHAAPDGLTPQILADVFSHDLVHVFGDIHIDAHTAEGCTGHDEPHAHHAADGGQTE